MATEKLMSGDGPRYVQMKSSPPPSPPSVAAEEMSSVPSFRQSGAEASRIFDELPKATIVSVSRPDASDISPMQLSYTICVQYKQFKWELLKKAHQVFILHFALKKRAIIEEIHEKQEQVKEWLQNLGIGEHTALVQDDDEVDDEAGPFHTDESAKERDVPSSAALPIIRPAIGRQQSIADRAKVAMQGYLNHFLGNISMVNSREVCKFLEVSKLSFSPEYGPKLKEDYVLVKHLPKIPNDDDSRKCCMSGCFSCCNDNWQKVWAVLKPGFLALLADPFDMQPLDIIVFDVLPASDGNGDGRLSLASEVKDRNPLRHSFKVTCGIRSIRIRVKSSSKVKDWVAAINDAGLRPPEGWCHPHRYGSFAPPRGLVDDGSQAQWFIDGRTAFEAIASSIEDAKSEIFICGWWLCPELYLRRPFHTHASSRLDNLLEAKARQGIQIYILLYKEVALALKINSVYSKRKLLSIHENVRVLRYPDHFSTGVYLWSHHEKLVIIDNHICFIGGLDLCFGRYDTPEHKVGDFPPQIWPGKDYYNPRESEPNSWEDTMKDELEREKYPRMPWHDVHCALWGPPCRDIARHFVQRWNYAKRNKAPYEQAIPLLMPQHHMVIPHYLGSSSEIHIESKNTDNYRVLKREDSFSSSSQDQDIPLLLPQESDALDSHEGNKKTNGLISLLHQLDRPRRISNGLPFPFRKAKIVAVGPDTPMKGFVDDLDSVRYHEKMSLDRVAHVDLQNTDPEWWETQERNDQGGFSDESGQVGPRASCRCQVIRSVSQWSAGTSQTEESIHNAYCSLIEKAEYFIYIEIGVVIEDRELIDSFMDGKPWKAGKFSLTLRLSLWSEHLGLPAMEVNQIMDPVVGSTYKEIWMATAKTNTTIYQDVFSCVPNDLIHTRLAFRQSVAFWKEKIGHTTIDLGIAPGKLQSYHDGDTKNTDPLERLASVRGHLVSFPLEFMCQESLRPAFNESEYYATQVFH
ncbi:phospholipase D zeta 1 isoform X4 [Abrus precatorius]|uniref:Phospholipase n=1 Tax=Abrus precatorius TaxID=3816 RepID=A0A8B8M536_ABRPR|nr:phospholipase D zeta 1 isoform X4 [Abrus precatorius]